MAQRRFRPINYPSASEEANDLTAAVTWANVPNVNITESSVTQHIGAIDHDALLNFTTTEHFTQGAISIPLSQISDVTALASEVNLLDLSGLTAGWVLSADTATTASWKAPTGGGASQLSDLSDVNTSTPTSGFMLIADGVDFESRALLTADVSDLTATASEVNLLDLSGLTAGWALLADTATTASWQSFSGATSFIVKADMV